MSLLNRVKDEEDLNIHTWIKYSINYIIDVIYLLLAWELTMMDRQVNLDLIVGFSIRTCTWNGNFLSFCALPIAAIFNDGGVGEKFSESVGK